MLSFILLAVVVVFVLFVAFMCSLNITRETFQGQYKYISDQFKYMKDKFDIGKPPGVLSLFPNQHAPCDSSRNFLVQNDVTFRPQRQGNGCTYIDTRFP
jgi:hypothetical protein